MPVIGADRAPRLCGVKSVEWLASLQAVAHASHALIVNIHNHPWCLRRLRVPDMNKPYHFPRSSSLLCAGCTYHAFTNSPSQGYCAAEGGQDSGGMSTTDFNAFHDCGSGETDLSQAQCEQAATAFADATGCGLACMQVRAASTGSQALQRGCSEPAAHCTLFDSRFADAWSSASLRYVCV